MVNPPYPEFEPYDVLQISYDDGLTWDDFCTIRDLTDAALAAGLVYQSQVIPGRLYQIVGGLGKATIKLKHYQ